MKNMGRSEAWDTQKELDYLDHIGEQMDTGNNRTGGYSLSREDMLNGYLLGAAKRTDWGSINASMCIVYCRDKLRG